MTEIYFKSYNLDSKNLNLKTSSHTLKGKLRERLYVV